MQEQSIGDGVHTLLVSLQASFPNGTVFSSGAVAFNATVTTFDEGSSGKFASTGASWVGAPDLSLYTVILNSPQMGIYGTIVLKSVSVLFQSYAYCS